MNKQIYELIKQYTKKIDDTRIYKSNDRGLIGLVNSDNSQTARKILSELGYYINRRKSSLDGITVNLKFYNAFVSPNGFILQFYVRTTQD